MASDTLTFSSVPLETLGIIPLTTFSGGLTVDYTSGSVTGSLQVAPAAGIDLTNYSSFTLTQAGTSYTITGTGTTAGAVQSTITIQYSGQAPTSVSTQYYASGVELASGTGGTVTSAPVCFASGTLIRTRRGDVAVESLKVGDVVVTASGTDRPVVWIGSRTYVCAEHPKPSEIWPVRVRAGAFGGDIPDRDLYLSPGHPVLIGEGEMEVLVPIMCLINGTSVARKRVEAVTYWHVELDEHDIVLAEGLAAESFLDYGTRPWFENGVDHALSNPDFVVPGLGARCRPVAIDGPIVEAERRRIDARFHAELGAHCAWPKGDAEFRV